MMHYQQKYDHLHNEKSKGKAKKFVRFAVLSLILGTLIFYYRALTYSPQALSAGAGAGAGAAVYYSSTQECDIYSGEWVHDYAAPLYYTHKTCSAIHEHQNCMKYGRPDTDYLKWRWKPHGCDIPPFNPAQFLELVRGKKMAFVGDSVARNQMQSLICLLSAVENPVDRSYTSDPQFKRWKYISYNFILASYWSPYLVKDRAPDKAGLNIQSVYLDEFDDSWTWQAAGFDYLIISAGHWFDRPLAYFEKGKIVGCHTNALPNVPDLGMYYGYQKAFRTAFKAINTISRIKNYRGVTFLRTYAPSHFENGAWNEGGNCVRTRPFGSNEKAWEGRNMRMYMTQVDEFRAAEEEGREQGMKFRLLNTTHAMLLRPDGHPSRYGHWPNEKVNLYNDCVHWCLPGPIDMWNSFLFEMLKKERPRDAEESLKPKGNNKD